MSDGLCRGCGISLNGEVEVNGLVFLDRCTKCVVEIMNRKLVTPVKVDRGMLESLCREVHMGVESIRYCMGGCKKLLQPGEVAVWKGVTYEDFCQGCLDEHMTRQPIPRVVYS